VNRATAGVTFVLTAATFGDTSRERRDLSSIAVVDLGVEPGTVTSLNPDH
jgi:hypothetical protein